MYKHLMHLLLPNWGKILRQVLPVVQIDRDRFRGSRSGMKGGSKVTSKAEKKKLRKIANLSRRLNRAA